jgi:hypothetical protein
MKNQNERARKTKIYLTIQEEEVNLTRAKMIQNTNLTIQNWREKMRSELGFFIVEFKENESEIKSMRAQFVFEKMMHSDYYYLFIKKWVLFDC